MILDTTQCFIDRTSISLCLRDFGRNVFRVKKMTSQSITLD